MEGESTVKTVPFNGRREKWREWKAMVLAYALKKEFSRLLVKETAIIKEEELYELGTTEQQKKDFRANAEGMSFLTLSCKGLAFAIIESTYTTENPTGNVYKAWEKLCKRYENKDAEPNYVEISEKFRECKLKSFKEDPAEWLIQVEYWNMKLGQLKETYALDDLQLKTHILSYLPVVLSRQWGWRSLNDDGLRSKRTTMGLRTGQGRTTVRDARRARRNLPEGPATTSRRLLVL